jgi:hypothetical protein
MHRRQRIERPVEGLSLYGGHIHGDELVSVSDHKGVERIEVFDHQGNAALHSTDH